MARTIRVYKDGNVWVAQKDGASKASAVKSTQKEAYMSARRIALNQGLTITVYYPTGGIKAVINPKNKSEEGNCFLTTACVNYFGLPDNCYELTTLRRFRDTYLLNNKEGKKLVKEYYSIAPAIVEKLSSDSENSVLFENIYIQIRLACERIERKEFEKAKDIYINAVSSLVYRYNKM